MPVKTYVADLMRAWRAAAQLSTAEAGARLGLSPRSIEDIEQGRRRADDELTRIALKKLIEDAK
jgi:predicted transcriptional regulator